MSKEKNRGNKEVRKPKADKSAKHPVKAGFVNPPAANNNAHKSS